MGKLSPLLLVILGLCLLLALGSLALAQSGLPDINWWSVDGGGGTSSGAGYTVSGNIGQPEAGGFSSDGIYSVSGGFWGAVAAPAGGGHLFLPFLQRQ